MKLLNITLVTCGAVGVLTSTGCAGDDTTVPAPTTSTAPAPPPSGPSPVPTCLVDHWISTAVPAGTTAGPAGADVTGGANIDVSIGRTGAITVGFTRMQPITFTATVGSVEVRGWFSYAGRAGGRMNFDPASGSSPAVSATGRWQPEGEPNWDDTRLTVELTDPVRERLLATEPLDRYVGEDAERTGHVVDRTPFFDTGRYSCSGDTLTVIPAEREDLPLILRRR